MSTRAMRRKRGLQVTVTAVALVFVVGSAPDRGASASDAAQGIASPDSSTTQASNPAPAPSRVGKSKLRMRYVTDFLGIEDPLSEGGAWSNNGLDWARVIKIDGMALGTQTGNDGYNDSYAMLSGFPPNQLAKAVVRIAENIDPSCTHEVELSLRWSDSPNRAQGYEMILGLGYLGIVRWNGAIGDFTELAYVWIPSAKDGDVFKATAVGNVLTGYINNVPLIQATDSTYSTGNPGIGFFRRNCGTNQDFTFGSFKARALR